MRKLLPLLCLAACTAETPVDQAPREPVVVYAAFPEDGELGALFDRYREQTGAIIIHRYGSPEAIVGDIIRNDVTPPADVLLTKSVVPAWQAAEEGALRPFFSDVVRDRVPAWARDSDELWLAIAADPAVFAYGEAGPLADEWAELGNDRFRGRLCLSMSGNPINRAVVSALLAKGESRTAELVVRGWISNLAQPPFASEKELAAAIAEGHCAVGILSRSAAREAGGLRFRQLEPQVATIAAAGIGRHARNADGAAEFIEWLVTALPDIDAGDGALQPASIAGRHDEEARRLAERARYR